METLPLLLQPKVASVVMVPLTVLVVVAVVLLLMEQRQQVPSEVMVEQVGHS
jgi:hypothetical protein